MVHQKLRQIIAILIGFALLLFAGYHVLRLYATPAAGHAYFMPSKFLVIAHRGGRGLGPENTLFTFQRAADMGVDVLEMDVRMTKDGQLVVLHDDTVERTTDGMGAVLDYTLAQLKKLDTGYRWTPDSGRSFPFRGKGLTVPTLAEVFTTFPHKRLNLEIKAETTEIVPALCRKIEQYQKADLVLVASFRSSVLKEFRRLCPEVTTSCTFRESLLYFWLSKARMTSIYSPPAAALQVPEIYGNTRVVTRPFVEAAHRRNMQVHVWTVNDVPSMKRLYDLGVDGIMTDYPDRLLRLVNRPLL